MTPRRRGGRVRTALTHVPLAALGAEPPPELREAEWQRVRHRAERSAAGLVAAKRALAALVEEILPGGRTEPSEFLLARDPSGKPRVVEVPILLCEAGIGSRDLHVSIAHTRRRAFGLATYQDRLDA